MQIVEVQQPDPTGETRQHTVLVLEDPPGISRALSRQLTRAGYHVVRRACEGYAETSDDNAAGDVTLLYVRRPLIEGRRAFEHLRSEYPDTPVVVVTGDPAFASRDQLLALGATDYLLDSCSATEIVARIALVLRAPRDVIRHRLRVADVELDLILRTATRQGAPVELAPREFEILSYLFLYAGRVVSRHTLAGALWPRRQLTLNNVLDVHIGRLRRKLETDRNRPLIRTVRNAGFLVPAR